MTRPWLSLCSAGAAVLLAGALVVQSGCTSLECGTGTIERDGECVASDLATDPATCGPGQIAMNEICVPVNICDPETTTPVMNPDGTITCRGQVGGGLPACGMPLPCPAAANGEVTICGEFYDLETEEKIGAQTGAAMQCDPDNLAESGPCSYNLEFYDAVAFAQGLGTQLPYEEERLIWDSCGRFRVTGLGLAGSGITAVGARGDITSGIAVRVVGNGTYPNQKLYTVRESTNAAYTAAIGQDILTNGVYVSIHVVPPDFAPEPGVVLRNADSASDATNYYFEDTDPTSRSDIDPGLNATGANGTAVLIGQGPITTFRSTGGDLPEGCEWNTISGGNIPGVYFIQLRVPFEGSSTSAICTP